MEGGSCGGAYRLVFTVIDLEVDVLGNLSLAYPAVVAFCGARHGPLWEVCAAALAALDAPFAGRLGGVTGHICPGLSRRVC